MKKLPYILYIIFLQIYIMCAAPTVTPIDSGELITAGICLGNAHSPGYPLHAILGKASSFIPMGNIAFRTNLLSGIMAALSICLLCEVLLFISGNWIVAVSGSILFGLSQTFWSQSVITEVYAGFFVLLIGIISCTARAVACHKRKRSGNRWLFLASFLGGLALGIHQMLTFLVPAFAVWAVYEFKGTLFRWRTLTLMIFFFLAGYSVLLYLPVRASLHPVYSWEMPSRWPAFKHLVMTATFNEQRFVRSFDMFSEHLANYFRSYMEQYPALLALLPFFGWAVLRRRNTGFFLFTFLCLVINLVSATALFNLSSLWFFTLDVFYLPGFFVLSIWGGYESGYLVSWLRKKTGLAGILVIFIILVWPALENTSTCYFKDRHLMRDWGMMTLIGLPPGSIIVTQQDEIFGLWYLKYGEGYAGKSDILHYQALYNPRSWFWSTVSNKQLRSFLMELYARKGRRLSEASILANLQEQFPYMIYLTHIVHDPGNRYIATPCYFAWRYNPISDMKYLDRISTKYVVWPFQKISRDRMDQVEQYYERSIHDLYYGVALIESMTNDTPNAIKLWNQVYTFDYDTRREAVRTVRKLRESMRENRDLK